MNEKQHLSQKRCKPCSGGLEQLSQERIGEYLRQVSGWSLSAPHPALSPTFAKAPAGRRGERELALPKIVRTWKFKDFKEALAFVSRVGELAETEGHHPDIAIHWNRVTLELWTHVAKGLTENDFILATKIDAL